MISPTDQNTVGRLNVDLRGPEVGDPCWVDSCSDPQIIRGYCNRHYKRLMRHGDPLGGQRDRIVGDEVARFMSKFDKTESCWEWNSTKYGSGYGVMRVQSATGPTNATAHRYSYEHFVGPIPEGLVLDHLCRNRACVNPDHLEIVTPAENTRRGFPFNWEGWLGSGKGRSVCNHGHEQTEETRGVYIRKSGEVCHWCKVCSKEKWAARRDARLAAREAEMAA